MKASIIVFFQLALVLKKEFATMGLGGAERPDIVAMVAEQARSWGAAPKDIDTITQFLTEEGRVLALSTFPQEASLRAAVQAIYENLCRKVGPVKTDTVLANALKVVAKTKAAQSFPPSKLL